MTIYFTFENSWDIGDKITIAHVIEEELNLFIKDRSYSADLETLYICLFCMGPDFGSFFKKRKPKYTPERKEYIYKGVQLVKEAKTYEYELRLDYQKYLTTENIKPHLANDIINSVKDILDCKKIKQLDLTRFQKDLSDFFHLVKWI
ncbi:hypothetical protein LQ567_24980 [Niabella pedocola]|uniref:Uncharacterized protein n=1 Tax=Niabella pedocola TaxID=1752077 RepID=A0ABS8Q0J2_9BACT|nr:hypothetical protein [Niabella pedocola]MCD2426062.1 hypothetical protein [Niabella pedocola]